ncbi:MAG: hypothetical protein AB1414_03010 [bacterium]
MYHYDEKRLAFLERYGYPNPMSLSTIFPEFFPNVYMNENGYWAYVFQRSLVPWRRGILFLTGDPICSKEGLCNFVRTAVKHLSTVGHIAVLQVHRPTAQALVECKVKKMTAHQFGVETQIPLPYPLTGQVGRKVRECIKQNLYVEELVYSENDIHGDMEAVYIPFPSPTVKAHYSVTRMTVDDYNREISKSSVEVIKESNQCEKLRSILRNVVHSNCEDNLNEYKRKLIRFLDGKLPKNIILFVNRDDLAEAEEISACGYYQPTTYGYNRHSFTLKQGNTKEQKLLLSAGKKLISETDAFQMRRISDVWLLQKKKKREIGPPLLKPYSEQYEPGRRLFVARDINNDIVGFVDFDIINWVHPDGTLERNKRGYYTNMVRTAHWTSEKGDIIFKNVRFLIIGAAMQRFAREGQSHINLGLNPLSEIGLDKAINVNGTEKKLTSIEQFMKWIFNRNVLNEISFNYRNLYFSKQCNWNNKTNVSVYMVYEGNVLNQYLTLFHGFLTTGAISKDTVYNAVSLMGGIVRYQKNGKHAKKDNQ